MKAVVTTLLLTFVSLVILLDLSWGKWVISALGVALCLYVCARLVTAAYFQSKRQYDERKIP